MTSKIENNNNVEDRELYREYRLIGFSFHLLPIIIFVLASFLYHNFWLLLGIPFCYLGGLIRIWQPALFFIGIGCIFYWTVNGFVLFSYLTLFLLCMLYGYYLLYLAKKYKVLLGSGLEERLSRGLWKSRQGNKRAKQ
jgi:hypothetical protein